MNLLLPAALAVTLTIASAISFARGAEVTLGDLAITSAWARATPPGAKVGAAYVTIENRGTTDNRLVSASTEAAGSAEAHETIEENGVASMRRVADLTIPAAGELAMAPGGIHLMLMGLTAQLKPGERLPLTLAFEKAGTIAVEAEVRPIGAEAPEDGHDGHSM